MTVHTVPHHAVSTLPAAVEWVVAVLWLLAAALVEHHAVAHAASIAGRVIAVAGSVAGVILLGVTP